MVGKVLYEHFVRIIYKITVLYEHFYF